MSTWSKTSLLRFESLTRSIDLVLLFRQDVVLCLNNFDFRFRLFELRLSYFEVPLERFCACLQSCGFSLDQRMSLSQGNMVFLAPVIGLVCYI
jgi:hypothetical protein